MNAKQFRQELTTRLKENGDRVLLRIVVDGPRIIELTGAELLQQAEAAARKCTAPPGKVVLLLLPHSLELFLLHIGLVLTGRIPAILAWPTSRVDAEKYQRNLLHQLINLPAEQLITLPNLARNLSARLPYPVLASNIGTAERWQEVFSTGLDFADEPFIREAPVAFNDPGEAIFLQFSGGTTGAQKAVVITSPMLVRQLLRLRDTLAFTPSDSVCSWLPMYHDMGLIACLWLPLWQAAPSLQMAASDWLLNPGLLFQYMQDFQGTFCWLPNFSFSYLAAQKSRVGGPYSLGHVRAWINCSEPVRLRSLSAFADAYREWGVDRRSLQASYAMAENVFAVTQTALGKQASTFPRASLSQQNSYASQLAFDVLDEVYVSSGTPLPGMQVRVTSSVGTLCAEGETGEIQLKTESMFSGYWTREGFANSAFTSDGWYATGDYGFVFEGELFVIGRLKDIIIVGGQNIFPEDVELVVNMVSDIYPGRVVAFGVADELQGTESIAIVAEVRGNFSESRADELQTEIRKQVLTTVGVAPRYVVVVPERWIVKSTAGKISRRETRDRFVREWLPQKQLRAEMVTAN